MIVISATELKTRTGQVLDTVHKGPVLVQSYGRDSADILDPEEYERVRRADDARWAALADAAVAEGFHSSDETASWLAEKIRRTEV